MLWFCHVRHDGQAYNFVCLIMFSSVFVSLYWPFSVNVKAHNYLRQLRLIQISDDAGGRNEPVTCDV